MGICLGKWVAAALVAYYSINAPYVPTLIEFVTALNGIKIIDTIMKSTEKSLDTLSDKVPKIVAETLDLISNKIKNVFK